MEFIFWSKDFFCPSSLNIQVALTSSIEINSECRSRKRKQVPVVHAVNGLSSVSKHQDLLHGLGTVIYKI